VESPRRCRHRVASILWLAEEWLATEPGITRGGVLTVDRNLTAADDAAGLETERVPTQRAP